MPRTRRPPSYRFHKARKCAVVTIHGKNHYLGPYGSPESHESYARLITKWRATIEAPLTDMVQPEDGQRTVNAVILQYLTFASTYYRKHGRPTGEIDNIRAALSSLKKLFGRSLAQQFGPKDLELVRNSMIDDDLCRKTVNGRVSRIKRMFRWASKEGLVPASAYHGLLSVDGLKFGRSRARETGRISPVGEEDVKKVLPHLNRHVRAMVEVQELTGMRPQEVRNLRTGDIDMTSDVWIFTPWTHKTEHHGHVRRIAIGPRAQRILQPYLNPTEPTAFVFRPKDAVDTVRHDRAAVLGHRLGTVTEIYAEADLQKAIDIMRAIG